MDQLELDSIYEELVNYYINDYAIFETVLKRDFLEVTGVLTEGAVSDFAEMIWEGIKKIFKFIVDKLRVLVNKFKEITNTAKTSFLLKKYYLAVPYFSCRMQALQSSLSHEKL